MEKFKELNIEESILKALQEEGFTEPTEIQEKAIPPAIQGKDILAGSATGSGKTLAFGAGIIQNSVKGAGIQALILTPTRELAQQVKESIKKFAKHKPLTISAVYGGMPMDRQFRRLKVADVVVGTPGRVLDHIKRKTIKLNNVKTLVLDEADRML
ncbi:DEAD/DEAH box helicase, partial [Candidatus Woesearchaeota archaeon]|nr:DEAD/DEAH box helicase [Candidatus Woesearchaeota archaeon]